MDNNAIETRSDELTPIQVADDKTTWAEYRLLLAGQSATVCGTYISRRYPEAASRGGLQLFHFPVLDFILDNAASAFSLRPDVSGGTPAGQAVLRGWRPTFERAWRQRFATRLSILHLRQTDTSPVLEVLCGDQIEAEPDPWYPTDWSRVLSATVKGESGDTEYQRNDDGTYTVTYKPGEILAGDATVLGTVPACPLYGWYRTPTSTLLPPADGTLRDLHVAAALQMSTTEFNRTYRLNQPVIYGANSKEKKSLVIGADLLWHLPDGCKAEVLQSNDLSKDGLAYVVESLKVGIRLFGLPPELLDMASRSETGAARAWDSRPLLALEERDRAAADEAVAGLLSAWLPLLGADFTGLTLACKAPADPVPVDRAQWVAGVRAEMELGLTTPAIELMKRLRIPLAKAEEYLARNALANAKYLKPVPVSAPPTMPQDNGSVGDKTNDTNQSPK